MSTITETTITFITKHGASAERNVVIEQVAAECGCKPASVKAAITKLIKAEQLTDNNGMIGLPITEAPAALYVSEDAEAAPAKPKKAKAKKAKGKAKAKKAAPKKDEPEADAEVETPEAPKTGQTFTRTYKDEEYVVTVTDDGFDVNGTVYRSLSAAASTITGNSTNGPKWFGLRSTGRGIGGSPRPRKSDADKVFEALVAMDTECYPDELLMPTRITFARVTEAFGVLVADGRVAKDEDGCYEAVA